MYIFLIFKFYLSGNAQNDEKPEFIDRCEFDLVDSLIADDPDILELLPPECKIANQDPSLRDAMKYEALKFKEFMMLLGNKELWREQGEDETKEKLDLDMDLRMSVYGGAVGNCTVTSATNLEYINCMTNYRQDMIDILNISNWVTEWSNDVISFIVVAYLEIVRQVECKSMSAWP